MQIFRNSQRSPVLVERMNRIPFAMSMVNCETGYHFKDIVLRNHLPEMISISPYLLVTSTVFFSDTSFI